MPRHLTWVSMHYRQEVDKINFVLQANLWKATTRKPMSLFLLFGWLLLRMDTRALS